MAIDSLVEPLRAVCVLDPAIDRFHTPLELYWETRDPDLIVELPGQRARWVELVPLTDDDCMTIDSFPSVPLRLRAAFTLAVRKVENFDGHGEGIHPDRPMRVSDGTERYVWSQGDYARIHRTLGKLFVDEIAQLAYQRVERGNFLGGTVPFTLPPSSALALEQIALRAAALAHQIDGTQPSEKSASRSPKTSPGSSGADTGASAESGRSSP